MMEYAVLDYEEWNDGRHEIQLIQKPGPLRRLFGSVPKLVYFYEGYENEWRKGDSARRCSGSLENMLTYFLKEIKSGTSYHKLTKKFLIR